MPLAVSWEVSPALPCKHLEALGYGEDRWGTRIIITYSAGVEAEAQRGDRLVQSSQGQLAAELVLDLLRLTPVTPALGACIPWAGADW